MADDYATPLSSDSAWSECINVTNSSLAQLSNETVSATSGGSYDRRLLSLTVAVLGILGNSACLLVVYHHRPMHTIVNIYLANLAVADNMVLVFGVIATAINSSSFYIRSEAIGCSYQVAISIPYYASMSIVSLVNLDRYYAICQPIKHKTVSSKARNLKRAAAAWTFGVAYSILRNLESILSGSGCRILQHAPKKLVTTDMEVPLECQQDNQHSRTPLHGDLASPLPFVVLLLVNIWLYSRIIRTLGKCYRRRAKPNQQKNPGWVKNIQKSRVRITKMLAVSTTVFFACNLMRTVLVLAGYVQDTLGTRTAHVLDDETATIYSFALLLFNSSVNPLIYVATNKKYRHAFRAVFLPIPATHQPSTVFHLNIPSR